jgi:hypothetical protein
VQDLRNKNSDLETQIASSTSQIQQQLQTTSKQLSDQQSIFTVLADDHRVQVPVTNLAGGVADAYYTWSPAQHKGFLLCEGLPALVAGTMFELWVVTKSGSAQKANPMQSFDSSNGACQVTMDYSSLSGTAMGVGITVEKAPMSGSQHASWLLYGNLASN